MSRRTIWLRDVYWIWTRYPFDLQLHLVDFCGIPCGVDSCCLLWSYTVNGGCCAPKVVEVGIIQPKHDGHQSCGILSCHSAASFFLCCNILWSLVKIKHYMRLWDTIWKSYQLSVWSCDVAFTTRPEKATNHTWVRKLVKDRGPQLHIIGVNKKSQSPVLGHFTGVRTPILGGTHFVLS